LILNCTQDTVLRFVPPLIITDKEIDEGIGILEGILADAGGRS
jgi:acetylornithine aminotransferase